MKKLFFTLYFLSFISFACTSDGNDNSTLLGTWELSAWNVAIGFDINNDGISSTNLLDEMDCINNEVLTFDSNNVVAANATFNPSLKIGILNGTSSDYTFDVTCAEGSIGWATTYSKNGNSIMIQGMTAILNEGQLSRVFENAIEIYNEDFSQLLETRDLTVIYTKL